MASARILGRTLRRHDEERLASARDRVFEPDRESAFQPAPSAPADGAAPPPPELITQTPVLAPTAIPADPLFGDQWHLLNVGQTGGAAGIDINVVSAWDDYDGSGVTVGIIDTGIEYTHPDLAANFNAALSWDALGNDSDPFAGAGENHGTTVAGTIAAANNGTGVVGVGPGADFAGFRMGFGTGTLGQIADNMWLQDTVDISNNSWGFNGFFSDDFDSFFFGSIAAALEDSTANGRDGLGTVTIFAGGNERTIGQDVNYHNLQNSPYTVAVAAIDHNGNHASFSNPGAALLVSAPGVSIATTDRVGGNGYVSTDYVLISGTSFSSPITAGVAALMLEANPLLGYRDVQEILALSARMNDALDPGWETNGAGDWNGGGMHFSHDYGFGLVDAHAAVRLAETWQMQSTYRASAIDSGSSAPNAVVGDGASLTDTITLATGARIDHVEVRLDISHGNIGDLEVILTSPDGTESVLVDRPGNGTASQNDIHFTFYSTAHWGETGIGDWSLSVRDASANGQSGRLQSWSIALLGDPRDSDDTYVFTDAFAFFAPLNYVLDDTAGLDVLNAAALTSASQIDLNPGATNVIDGSSFEIGASTVIETVFGGGGDDTIAAGPTAAHLDGGRGSDEISGAAGDDSLFGGDGGDSIAGGDGGDALFGDGGGDTLDGGGGIDTLVGGDGDDRLLGGAENDILAGLADDDHLAGGDGVDLLAGGHGADSLHGDAGADILLGEQGDDLLVGGAGGDALVGGSGADTLVGGDGTDILTGNSGLGAAADGAGDWFDFDRLEFGTFDLIEGFDTAAPVAGGDRIDLTDLFGGLADLFPDLESAALAVNTDLAVGHAVIGVDITESGASHLEIIAVALGIGDATLLDDNILI